MMTDALILALHRYAGEGAKKRKRLYDVAEMLVQKATEGDVKAIEIVFDRTDGRVAQAIELALNMPLAMYVPRDEKE